MEPARYQTKLLSPATWADFQALFTRGNGWDHCWCMAYQREHGLPRSAYPTRVAVLRRECEQWVRAERRS